MRFCTSCGTQLQDGAQVCPNCGQRVVGVNPNPMGGGQPVMGGQPGSFCGLNDDTMTSYIEQYGEPNDQSDTFIEYTWESINFLVTFDDASHKADYVNLLVIQGN